MTAAPPEEWGRRSAVAVDGYLQRTSDAATACRDRRELRRWIERRGWRVARLHEDVPPARSGLRAAIGRVQSRETDGVVAACLTQLGGTLHEALATVERIQAAGGIFVSVHDRLDLSTPAGRRRHRHLLAMTDSGAEVRAVTPSRLPRHQAAVRERPERAPPTGSRAVPRP